MNGSPSVKVALNPRADGSMSPEYTLGKSKKKKINNYLAKKLSGIVD